MGKYRTRVDAGGPLWFGVCFAEFSDERKHINMQYLTVRILKTFLGG
jgi:hypothetical protein